MGRRNLAVRPGAGSGSQTSGAAIVRGRLQPSGRLALRRGSRAGSANCAPRTEDIVRYEEDGPRVVLLDQRRLPDEEVELECRSVAEVVEAIRELAIRGAPAIGVAAAYGLALAAELGEDLDDAAAAARRSPPDRGEPRLGARADA